ncbi:MAG: glucose 1-dehydrogenase [Proteobacteria bacterium]|nr:glucose 1-dehydrogenase [Pseudomonadota bacterium]
MDGDLFDLSGKVALITGSSSGIGESTARLLAAYGAHVVVSSRKLDACEKVAESIRDEGGSAEAIELHVGDRQRIRRVVDEIVDVRGRLDILVNNAAVNPWIGAVWKLPESAWDKLLEVNLSGVFMTSVEAVKRMKEQGGGRIVNIGSRSGLRPDSGQVGYAITKTAVEGLTRAFARECGPLGITVNAVTPGVVETQMSAPVLDDREAYAKLIAITPLRRHASTEEISPAVLFLVSSAGSFVNGAVLRVDGGNTL